MRLEEKVVVVTGGGSSVGRAICRRAAAEGARVVVADRDEDAGHGVVEAIIEAGGTATFARVDVTDEAEIQAMVGDAILAYGTINGLVNGVSYRKDGDPMSTTREEWAQSVAHNLESAWLCARTCLPFLKAAGGGSLVHLAPTHIVRTMPKSFAYAASKGGLLAMSRAMAIDFGPYRVRSNVLITGFVQSDHTERRLRGTGEPETSFRRILSVHPLGRVGTPEDIARAATFLLSDDASFISGTSLMVDGGRSAVIQDLHDW
jgi:NAD(P)-dependent dehydrogenase (short-subunit alcohol dehydrogenase family)